MAKKMKKRKHLLRASLNNSFCVEDILEERNESNLNHNDANFSAICTSNPDISYVLIKKPHLIYAIPANSCYKACLIPVSERWGMQVDGYQTFGHEYVTISTFFGYRSSLKFFPSERNINNNQKNLNKKEANQELVKVKTELDTCYSNFITPSSEQDLLKGSSLLIRFEVNHLIQARCKLVLEYLLKSSNNTQIKYHIDNGWAEHDKRKNWVELKEDDGDYVTLVRRMDTIFENLNILPNDIILVSGATNCGKSSLIHHLINRYISENAHKNRGVFYLESDPGQTEFAPCGILSLVNITERIFSIPGFKFIPNNSSLLTQPGKIVSKIFGSISPSDYSISYIDYIKQLSDHYKSLQPNQPLFVNTMGWINGLGLELLTKTINIIRPSKIVRVQSNHEHIIPQLDKYAICNLMNNRNNFNYLPQDLALLLDFCRQERFVQLWLSSSCVADGSNQSLLKTSSVRREINQLSYLASNFWPDMVYLPFYSLKPYRLSLSTLYVHIPGNRKVFDYLVYDLLNKTWIIIGNIDHNELPSHERDSNSKTKFIEQLPSSTTCFGCGVVRTIDSRDDCIYILMPKIFDQLINNSAVQASSSNSVNLLVVPDRISIPSGLLNEQFLYHLSSTLPYITETIPSK